MISAAESLICSVAALIRCLALAAVHACLNEEYDEEVVDEAVTELDEG